MSLHDLETDRLESLRTYDLDGDLGLEGVLELAASACDAPVAYVCVVEEEVVRVLACVGSTDRQLAREGTFCSWVVDNHATLVVPDVRADRRFVSQERVAGAPGTQSFAGLPLIGRDGLPLGVLCVADLVPRQFSLTQLDTLRTLADGVVNVLELRRLDRLAGAPGDVQALGRRLRRALDHGELVTWFQPVVHLASGAPNGLEALVRWEHPQRGVLGPSSFLSAVDRSGLSLPLGRHVLHQALRTLADLGSPDLRRVAVNVSPLQLARPGLASSVLADLAAHRLDPSCLSLEVTEQGLAGDIAVRELSALREAGVQIALDDYGTGRASLKQLLDLPITSLKLDGSLVNRLSDPRVVTVVRSTITMATDLGIEIVAEGVETEEQRCALLSLGCTVGQGHLFSVAVSTNDLPDVLSQLSPDRPVVRPAAADHVLLIEGSRSAFVETLADRLADALRAGGPVILVASGPHRTALESAVEAPGFAERCSVLSSEDLVDDWSPLLSVPAGATVISDLSGLLWSRGNVSAAIELEDFLGRLPATVCCGHESWALAAHGTPQQLRRLHEQHGREQVAPVVTGLAALRPDGRELVERMLASGASSHSIAAALGAEGFPSPSGVRWHWRQVERLLTDSPA
ncbi:MAG: diguanylate phosphodiesterase [Frankiales bacterium]|nr:diguanylate phosphodiesterase [Frankiales bacterium]